MNRLPLRHLLPALAVLLATGGLLFAQNAEPAPTIIESDGRAEMLSTDQETTITFRDNVRVAGTGIRLTCDLLEVVVERTGDVAATLGQLEKFRSMVATGNVRIIQEDREAACGRAEVLPGQDKIVLSDSPVVALHAENARIAGETITMWRGQRRVEVDKPTVVGPPIRDLGFDKDKEKKAAAPAPAAEAPKQP